MFGRKTKSKNPNQTAAQMADAAVQQVLDYEQKFKNQFGFLPVRPDNEWSSVLTLEQVYACQVYFRNPVISKTYVLAQLWCDVANKRIS